MPTKFSLKNFITLFVLVTLSYAYVLNGDFLGDDVDRIFLNSELNSFWSALTGELGDRPVLMLIVTGIFKLFGLESIAFRLVSIFIHCLVAVEVYKFIMEYNKDYSNPNKNYIALACSFLFALHPLSSQSITTSIQMSVLLTGLFGLLSLKYFLRGITSTLDPNFIKSLIFFLLGILCKPNLVFLALFYLIYKNKIRGNNLTKAKVLLAYAFTFIIPILFYTKLGKNTQNEHSSLFYFLVQSDVLFTYFRLILAPFNLKFLYDFDLPPDPWMNRNWLLVLAHAFILLVAYTKLPRKLFVLVSLFYLSFVPESSFFPINHLAFEHRTYFALIFFFIFIGSTLTLWHPNDAARQLGKIAFFGLSGLYLILNQSRNLEIKRYGDWALHTLENSNQYDYHNFMLCYLLARSGNFEKIEPIIRNYPNIKPNKDYDILVDILDYYKTPITMRMSFLNVFLDFAQNRALQKYSRIFVNKILIEDFANKSEDISMLIRIELALGRQMKYFLTNRNSFSGPISNFLMLGRFLLSPQYIEIFRSTDYLGYLEIKAILYMAYNIKFPELKNEIESELLKNPNLKILIELKDGIEAKDKKLEKKI